MVPLLIMLVTNSDYFQTLAIEKYFKNMRDELLIGEDNGFLVRLPSTIKYFMLFRLNIHFDCVFCD